MTIPPPSPQPGSYPVERTLGVGALCDVVLARDPQGRAVVVKRLHRHCAADPGLVAMFQHEARVLSVLDHPGLPAFVGHGCDDRGWYLAQRHVEGVDLATLVSHPPPHALSMAEGITVVGQVLLALHHAHTRTDPEGRALEIVHRDVAPANVRIGTEGAVTLLDWGLSTSVWRRDPDHGQMKGTRGYMAPEVVTGAREADARSDLFATGVLLYELTVGRRLYDGGVLQVMVAVAEGPVPSPARVCEGYPASLDAVVQRSLARCPEDRYPTAAGMAEALVTACAAAGIANGRADLARRVQSAVSALDVPPER